MSSKLKPHETYYVLRRQNDGPEENRSTPVLSYKTRDKKESLQKAIAERIAILKKRKP